MNSTGAAALAASVSAATTQRFDRHVSNATCRLMDINEHLLCALCSGYLVDATTIIECLHTFCRSCIVRYLESSETCPVCDVPLHQTNPLLGIRADTTLQTLVYKLVPGVFKDEVKRRCTVINNAQSDGKSSSMMDRLLKDICDMTTGGSIYSADEQFSICLQYAPPSLASSTSSDTRYGKPCSKDSCAISQQQDLSECSYLLCPASVTVAHLKKLIRSKLELSANLPLDLYHSSPDGSLDDVYTLADVAYITAWTSVKPLHFYYQVNAKSVKKISEETDCKRSEKYPGGACLKRIITDNRQNAKKVKGVFYSSFHKKSQKTAAKKIRSPMDKCLALQIPKGSCRKSFSSTETSPISGETKESEPNNDSKDYCRRKENCHSQDSKATKLSLHEPRGVESAQRDFVSKEIASVQTIAAEREMTDVEVTDTDIAPKTSPKTVDKKSKLSVSQEKSPSTDCSPSADSALSPSRPETVSQSVMTVDGFETTSDAEGYAIDSASSPPPSKRMKISDPNDRNLFAAINSMIVNNDNVVSSSTSSSQASADDSGDNKTSVETQTTAKLISRCSKKAKPRGAKKESTVKSRSLKQNDGDVIKSRSTKQNGGGHARLVQPPSSGTSAGGVLALSADTSGQCVDASTQQQGPSATLCVPICIGGDKTGVGGSNLILNLPQNVSVQCRIRSDKILIASNPTADAATTTFSSISYSQSTAKNPILSITQSQATPTLPSQAPPTLTSQATPTLMSQATPTPTPQGTPTTKPQTPPTSTSQGSPTVTSQAPPTLTSKASTTLTSKASTTLTSKVPPTVTSKAALAVTSPAQHTTALSGQTGGSSIPRTTVTPSGASNLSSSSANNGKSDDNRTSKQLPRQPDTMRTITKSGGNLCNSGVTSAGECQASRREALGKEAMVRSEGTVGRAVDHSETAKDRLRGQSLGTVPVHSAGKSPALSITQPQAPPTCGPRDSPTPLRCAVPARTPENASTRAKPPCESRVVGVATKTTCSKDGQKEASQTTLPIRGTTSDPRDVVKVRDKVPPQGVATAFQRNQGATDVCKTISSPNEMAQMATISKVSANSVTAVTPSGAAATTKAVLFKPYQITTTTTSRVTSPDVLTAPTTTFQSRAPHNQHYPTPTFPIFPNFPFTKDQPNIPEDANCITTRDSLPVSAPPSCETTMMTKSGLSAVHRTMSNIPLHSVIKIPTYTVRKNVPQNRKSERKGSRSPRNDSAPTPAVSVGLPRKPETCVSGQKTLGATKSEEDVEKLKDHPTSDHVHKVVISAGSPNIDRSVFAPQITSKATKDDDSLRGKVDEGWTTHPSPIRSCLKLPLVGSDALEKGAYSSSNSSISTSSNEQLPSCASPIVVKAQVTKRRLDLLPTPSGHRQSPKRMAEKASFPGDELSYTYAEADSGTSPGAVSVESGTSPGAVSIDSGTSPGAVSLSPPRCTSKNDAAHQGSSSPTQLQSSTASTSLRKKLVIDLERCTPRQGRSSTHTPSPSASRSHDKRLHCCSPSTTTVPPPDPPLSSGQATPPRLVISLPRCQIPATPTTQLGPCTSQWSPTSSGTGNNSPPGATDNSSPPTTKRLKLMCNGMTIYRTLESPGSRSPRRTSGVGGGSSRRSSPVSAPVVADTPVPPLIRASSNKSPSSSSSSPPQGKCRRKSNSSAPLSSSGATTVHPKTVVVPLREPSVTSVDSTSTSPRAPATTPSLPGSDSGLFTVMIPPWKGNVPLPRPAESVEEPLELTTKEVKERQKEREYAKLLSNLRSPPSAFTT